MEYADDTAIKIQSLKDTCEREQEYLLKQVQLINEEEDVTHWERQYEEHNKNVQTLLCNQNIQKTDRIKLNSGLKKLKNIKRLTINRISKKKKNNNEDKTKRQLMEAVEKNLLSQIPLLKHKKEKQQWIKDCNIHLNCINEYLLNENKISIGSKQNLIAQIANLTCEREKVLNSYEHVGFGLEKESDDKNDNQSQVMLKWGEIDSKCAFKGRIITGIIINLHYIDPSLFLKDAKQIVVEKVKLYVKHHTCIKVNTIFNGEFVLKISATEVSKNEIKSFRTKNVTLINDITSNLEDWYENEILHPILALLEEFQERDSGWALSKIISLIVNINKCDLLKPGKGNHPLPLSIRNKKAVIYVEGSDTSNDCFAWAIISSLYPTSNHMGRKSSYPNYNDKLNWMGITFPVTTKQVPIFERNNKLSINIYQLITEGKNNKHEILPLYLGNKEDNCKHINLLTYESNDTWHYVWIKNLSRLLSSQITRHQHKSYICDRCLNYFHTENKLKVHYERCKDHNKCKIELVNEEQKWITFKNYRREIPCPFIIYADFECLLVCNEAGNLENCNTYTYQTHVPYSIGYYLHCNFDESLCQYVSHRAKNNVASLFISDLEKIIEMIYSFLKDVYADMIPLTSEQIREFDCATHCFICGNIFIADDIKVRDHCHWTGRYRGAAHNACNLNFKSTYTLPIVFHNLCNYDAHFLIEEVVSAKFYNSNFFVIASTAEKYISFTSRVRNNNITIELRFIDSFKFLNTSLDRLASSLDTNDMKILRSNFSLDNELFNLLTRKGVFPYEYVDCYEKLNDTRLPSYNDFYSSLHNRNIERYEYEHAQNVWSKFNVSTLGEYSDLYLKTDVLLLAESFEKFRKKSMEHYKIDPAYYCTLPSYAWDVMLKITNIKLELLTDIDMILFIENGIRGGFSQCSHRHAKANNRYMGKMYDSSQETSYLMYYDINNLYGMAMCDALPYANFKWMNERMLDLFPINSISDDSEIGYILEVDLEYPNEIHDEHSDLPFCPTLQNPPNGKCKKLLATLYHKSNYVIHYRTLQQCLQHGLVIRKIHRILQFNQSPWMRQYIELNTRLRTLARTEFEIDLFKLMNNAVFGKTMENVRNRVDIKLFTSWNDDKRNCLGSLIGRPNFHRTIVFNENFVAIEMKKMKVRIDKPIYIGMSILDISKIYLYRFHYDYAKKQFGYNCKLLYTDTDSLIYKFRCDDIYNIMKRDINYFDTSNYPVDNIYGLPLANKKVLGLMKDENGGQIMTHFVGLRSKMYSIKVDGKPDVKKAKGVIKSCVSREIKFEDYVNCLFSNDVVKKIRQNRICSKLHEVRTISEGKIALRSYDDKRYITDNCINTLPWGHYSIEKNKENL